MAEIHKFQAAPRQIADPGSAERHRQAEAIRQEINKGSRQHANAAKDAAAELWKLFDDRGQDFKRQVCKMVWGAKDPKPTRNLWSLVWDPKKGSPKAKTARKPAALTIYLRLAQAAAKVGGEDEDDVILRVFPNLLNGPEAFAKRDLGPAELLLETFWSEWLAVNERIAADCDLRGAFPIAMELPVRSAGNSSSHRGSIRSIASRTSCSVTSGAMPRAARQVPTTISGWRSSARTWSVTAASIWPAGSRAIAGLSFMGPFSKAWLT